MADTLRVYLHESSQENEALSAVLDLALHFGADLSKPDSIMNALQQAKARPTQKELMRRAIAESEMQSVSALDIMDAAVADDADEDYELTEHETNPETNLENED